MTGSWTEVRIGRISQTINGSGFPHEYQGNSDGEHPFLKVSDLKDSRNSVGIFTSSNFISESTRKKLGARIVPEGAIVFPKVGAALLANARALTMRPCLLDNNLMAVVPVSGNARFWRYALSCIDLGELAGSGPLPFVSDSQVRDIRLMMPPEDEQRRIADFLDAETGRMGKIESRRRGQIGLLGSRRFSLVRSVLVTGLRHAKLQSTHLSWLPSIPQDWSLIPLRYLTRCLDRYRVPLSSEERASRSGPFPYYGASEIVDYIDDHLFDEPLVLLGEDGAQLGNQDSEIAFYVEGKYWVNNHAHVLRPVDIDGRLLVEVLNVFDRNLHMSGSTRQKITKEEMNKILVPVPPRDQQEELVEYIAAELNRQNLLKVRWQRQLELLAERRGALVAAAVTGEFDVSSASGRGVME